MSQENVEIKFIKLKYGVDLVAFLLEETDTKIKIKRPLCITIENNFMTGRQMMEVREWIPPIVTMIDEIEINKSDIIMLVAVRDSFKDDFNEVINYVYGVIPRRNATTTDESKIIKIEDKPEKTGSTTESKKDSNIIPFYGRDTSTKPN